MNLLIQKLLSFEFYKKNYFIVSVFLILALATFLRFYNFGNRYALAGDPARDAIIARYALENHRIPATGPFSSAGNFTTGNIWYIWLILSSAIYPFSILTPWIVMAASYVFIVFMMILIGYELLDKKFGIILGLLSAVSFAQINQSLNLANPSLVALFSTLAIYFLIKYVKTGKNLFAFLFSLFIAIAINTHFQAMYLLVLIPLAYIFKRPKPIYLISAAFGLTIPFIPFVIFDVKNNFYNFRGIIDYLQYGQYKIYVANRWFTYAGIFWPQLWSSIVGGIPLLGYFTIFLLIFAVLKNAVKRKLNKEIILLILSFAVMFFALRYYRGERFFGYFVFLHPFIITLSGFAYYAVFKMNKILGVILITILVLISINRTLPSLLQGPGDAQVRSTAWEKLFSEVYPGKKFQLYSYISTSEGITLPLALYLYRDGRLSDTGYKIGFGSTDLKERPHFKMVKDIKLGFEIWDLNSSTSAQLRKSDWHSVNPSAVYKISADWYDK